MVRGGKVGHRSNFKRRVRSKDEGSDDSDEDYVASKDGFGSFIDDYKEEKKEVRKVVRSEDEDYEEVEPEEEDDEVEFTLDEEDCLDEEEELTMKKKRNNKNVSKQGLRKRRASIHRTKRKKSAVAKKPLKKGGRKKRQLEKKRRIQEEDDDDYFVSSGSSDYEYTISEEEREQVKEANRLCGSIKTSLRSSSSSKTIPEVEALSQRKKPPGRKGKEKIEQTKAEVIKQVCGVCLSKEDKRRLRGKLNCCSHYFCFTCIMEWSKVESRCPLCKQRFETIIKPARSTAGVDLRDVVIQIPKRDQAYQPSEEELRSYLDPYTNVICSECSQGGDDELMLLCDICDSSAHTYCVGLGWEVPEGNWYCSFCRPVVLGSSSSQVQDSFPDQRTINNLYNRLSTIANRESLDSIRVPSPCTPFPPGFAGLSSPRFLVVDIPSVSPVPGLGAQTLTGRRWLHRQIKNLRSMNRMNLMAGRLDGVSTANIGIDFVNSHIDQSRQTTVQQARTQHMGLLSPRSGDLMLWPQLAGISSNEQLYQCSNGSNIRPDVYGSSSSSMAKEQLQVIVRNQLKALSNNTDLDNGAFTDIATNSVHTILAACGLEHKRSEVHIVPPLSNCTHIERVAAGQVSLMKGCYRTCFDSFVKDVVKRIMDTRSRQWLSSTL
ncbi:Detected protein of confused Function [Hibiscus syriacus]|uniref:Detected protein of confused Function n=1 Tax=Hibiscus syriacus TaxID=106335 RepID=A0A6A3B3V4_HIBSY|nr:Detected protein of confused Function [Hibiscus syriacus]